MSDINGSKPTNFPLDESKLDFKIPRTDAPRENVLKLGSMITNRIGLKATADDPEYWGLAGVMTDEMVDVALKMGVRKPKTTEQLMKLTKMEREPLEKLLTEMAWTGIIEYNWENLDGKNPKHEKRWVLPLFVPGSAEFLNMRKSQIDEHPEVDGSRNIAFRASNQFRRGKRRAAAEGHNVPFRLCAPIPPKER